MISVNIKTLLPDIKYFQKRYRYINKNDTKILDTCISNISFYFDPKYVFLKANFDFIKHIKSVSNDISKLLEGSKDVYLVMCTIGKKYLDLINTQNLDIRYSLCFDFLGSIIVENLAEHTQNKIFNQFYSSQKNTMTKRYSPGYGDFNIEEQKFLFNYFKENKKYHEIDLTNKFVMVPEKSISYIFGVI